MKTAIQLLRESYKIPQKDIDIPLGDGEVLKAKLLAPDIWDIQDEISDVYEQLLNKYLEQGLGERPIVEGEWQKELAQYSEEARKNLTKPANRAEQKADAKSKTEAIRKIIPKYLYHRDTDKPLFNDAKELEEGTKRLFSKMSVFSDLASAFVELSSQITEDQKAVKN